MIARLRIIAACALGACVLGGAAAEVAGIDHDLGAGIGAVIGALFGAVVSP